MGASFLDDAIALRAMDAFSKYHLVIPLRSKSRRDIWDVSCSSRIAIYAGPKCIQMEDGSGADDFADRRTRTQFQGAGANPGPHEGRNGLARATYDRLAAGDRFSGNQIFSVV